MADANTEEDIRRLRTDLQDMKDHITDMGRRGWQNARHMAEEQGEAVQGCVSRHTPSALFITFAAGLGIGYLLGAFTGNDD